MTETILRRLIERGISISDMDEMTLGMALDYLVTCNNEDYEADRKRKNGTTRQATQADIDAF